MTQQSDQSTEPVALAADLRLIAAWHTPGGPTPSKKCPDKMSVCLRAAAILAAQSERAPQASPEPAQGDAQDAARWRFFEGHAQHEFEGRPLCQWMALDGVLKFGSRNAAIDAAIDAMNETKGSA